MFDTSSLLFLGSVVFAALAVYSFSVSLNILFYSSDVRSIIRAPFMPLIWSVSFFSRVYKLHEFDTSSTGTLPKPPGISEKYMYVSRKNHLMLVFSLISFTGIQISVFNFIQTNSLLWPLYIYLVLSWLYFLDSFLVNMFSKDFDLTRHKLLVEKWRGHHTEPVDIFLPTAGEPLAILENTWKGIKLLQSNYAGGVTVYCLDDANRVEVKRLALKFGFVYEVRPDRGRFKKAGNLRHGFRKSNGTYIAIFDADFVPRADFLHELLPYFYEDTRVGLVQSPQYFDVHSGQNWLQRGAGAVQELFYRVSQVSRQGHNASICVGSNALYRREALAATGGTALIEHSEDVHTGYNIRMQGWTIQYVPVLLAKGLCPADMKAYFKQQYRWCLGSMTLLASYKFWAARLPLMTRLSYFSGFFYYIHTAISSFFVPVIPIAIMLFYPHQVTWVNYLLILPSLLYVQFIYPLWHKATYGIESWATRQVYGWAHLFAITDKLLHNTMQWQATGARLGRDMRYIQFRILQIVCNLLPALVWVFLAAEQVLVHAQLVFLPILLSGVYYYALCAKVTFYTAPAASSRRPSLFVRLRPAFTFATVTSLLLGLMHAVLNGYPTFRF